MKRSIQAIMAVGAVGMMAIGAPALAQSFKIGTLEIKGKPAEIDTNPFAMFGGGEPTLRTLVDAIHSAATSASNNALLVRLKDAQLSMTQTEELGAAMDAYRQKGGQALMTLPATPLKCAGAPLKMTFMLVDRLRQAGTRSASRVEFHSALGNVFSVDRINQEVLERWQALDVPVTFNSKLVAIDIGARRARFTSPEGELSELDYDFIHVVPPMRAPDAVKNSPLPWQEGGFAAGGWLEVDKETLHHRRYPNVFGLGDINGTPRGKTAATVKKSAPIVTRNLIDVIAGKAPSERFDGYTSCPLLLREGSALLVEFDYEGRLTPSLPMIDPLQDSYFAWLMKYRLLKPAYIAVAKGRV